MNKREKEFIESNRKHIGLITNHGYAGAKIPIGGAPDTGGQNFYVNTLAETMEKLGYKVTIFTRGGFPFFNSTKMRKGSEFLSKFVRYVYIPAGPPKFIPKENIGYILDEEIEWLYEFLNKEAKIQNLKPYNLFLFINSHYWDAALIIVKLIQKWQNDLLFDILKKDKSLVKQKVFNYYYENRHKLNSYASLQYIIGNITLNILPEENIKNYNVRISKHLKKSYIIQKKGDKYLKNHPEIKKKLSNINRHLWTPHSLGEIKMRNYWNKDVETKRRLKFLERISYEQYIVNNTPYIAATSDDIVQSLIFFYNAKMNNILFFPPCIDTNRFYPRKPEQIRKAYKYLSNITGIDENKLKKIRIIFETSRMDYTKRKDVLINAFRIVTKKRDDTILVIGGGPENDIFKSLKKLIKKNRLEKKVFLTGYIPQEIMEEIFSIADVFATSSEMEGFGMTASQAAASFTPIVSSNLVPFCVNYLQDSCIIIKAGDIKGFASGILKLLENSELSKKLSEKAYKISMEFNWEKKTKEIIEFMQRNLSYD